MNLTDLASPSLVNPGDDLRGNCMQWGPDGSFIATREPPIDYKFRPKKSLIPLSPPNKRRVTDEPHDYRCVL